MRVLITGSSKGIGRETAVEFARHGWDVCLHGRNPAHLAEAIDRVRAVTVRPDQEVVSVQGDLTNSADCDRIVAEAVSALGGLDALVNNAGIAMRGRFEDLRSDVWERVMAVNSLAPAFVTRAALTHLKGTRGSVVFISSAVGFWGFPMVSAYSASKHALNGLVQSLRTETADSGLHVGMIYVGIVENDEDKQILRSDGSHFVPQPRRRALTQRAVARAVVSMVRRRQRTRVLSVGARLTRMLAVLAPRLLDFVLRRATKQIERLSR
jgi:NAD(P)-dependent dehydrogenase (short-subunit alcohol dehydrogenase family)